ncbi:MAG TPA: PEPxxWA-CTERM sorting domain-containing protein [Phenylobacterium sp.]
MAASVALAVATAAHADVNLVTNGSFSSGPGASTQFGGSVAPYNTQPVTGWTGGSGNPTDLQFYFVGNTNAANQWNDGGAHFGAGFTPSPDGGAFVGLDGDLLAEGSISQVITGLVVGQTYTLTFNWAASQLVNRTLPTTEELHVTFGNSSYDTAIMHEPSQGFSGWLTESVSFKADATTQTLKFLSIGSPNGEPPIALLDGVSLTVPEPSTWAMMLVGFGGIGAMVRRRRQTLVAA